jgi:DNA polymerase-4
MILHVDMDAFYAAVEQRDRPELRGTPVIVGGTPEGRGVVSAASYEARQFGVHSAMPASTARRLCPLGNFLRGRMNHYADVSRQIHEVLHRYTPLVEPVALDEAYLDVTGSTRLWGPADEMGREIKRAIRQETGLAASVGVAPNKFLAKLASDLEKPDGLTVIEPDRVDEVLLPLPVTKLWGVGPATAERLRAMGVRTVGDIRAAAPEHLRARLGDEADRFIRLAHGRDDRAVTPDREAKSISHEQTFGADLAEPDAVRAILFGQVEQVARRLRTHGLFARTVTLKIRYGDFETITRSATLEMPTHATDDLWQASRDVYDRWATASFSPVRLIGMGAGQLSHGPGQLGLFGDEQHERRDRLDAATDAIAHRFGKRAIGRGGAMG